MLPSNVLEWLWHQLEFNYGELTRVYREVVECLTNFPSLRPRTDVYTSEQGHSDLLLLLYGPLPTKINNQIYGIPIEIWIPKQYPHARPIVFVRPTAEMRINANSLVDTNGRVYSDMAEQSSLSQHCQQLAYQFGLKCPVYSQPQSSPAYTRPPPPVPAPAPHKVTNIMDELPVSGLSIEKPAPTNESLRQAVEQTAARILASEVAVDLKALENTRQVLDYIEQALQSERTKLEAAIDDAQRTCRVLDEHIAAARNLIAQTFGHKLSLLGPDELAVAGNSRAQTWLDCTAKDAAIADTLTALSTMLSSERINLAIFIKHTRQLARKQFIVRVEAETARKSLIL